MSEKPGPPPTWPQLKVAQAESHAWTLKSAIRVWNASNPLTYEPEAADDRHSYALRLRVHQQPPVEQWSLMVGDCLHNLRSALDAMVWLYATANGAEPPRPRQVAFPIVTDPNKWAKTRTERLQTTPDAIAQRIAELQPFQDREPAANLLVMLGDLNNVDKHQGNLTVKLQPKGIAESLGMEFYSPTPDGRANVPHVDVLTDELLDGDVILVVRGQRPIREQPSTGYQLAIEALIETRRGPKPVEPVLWNLCQATRKALSYIWSGSVPQ